MAKKKTRRRGAQGGGVDVNERRQQRLEARRQERIEAAARAARAARRERIVRAAVTVGLLLVVFYFLFLRTPSSSSPDSIEGHRLRNLPSSGVNEHTQDDVDYESTPPVTGAHDASPAACGTYAEPVRDENQVHTLEHGAVGIQFRPDVDANTIRDIESLVEGSDSHLFSAPYPGMPTPIAVSAWSHLMPLQTYDESAIRKFISEFREQGPEDQDCPSTSSEAFEATGATPEAGNN